MMQVLSQFSFLKWANKSLFLDNTFDLRGFLKSLEPFSLPPATERAKEFVNVTKLMNVPRPFSLFQSIETPQDLLFTEGSRTRITHLKIERSPLLRKLFFENTRHVYCDMCGLHPRIKYPWTDNLLEIHHLLPLSSGLALTNSGTSLKDIVPLCPNCHRSVHLYYKRWLNQNQMKDFTGKNEAEAVYQEAKQKVVA